jgi:hypothetical protein
MHCKGRKDFEDELTYNLLKPFVEKKEGIP